MDNNYIPEENEQVKETVDDTVSTEETENQNTATPAEESSVIDESTEKEAAPNQETETKKEAEYTQTAPNVSQIGNTGYYQTNYIPPNNPFPNQYQNVNNNQGYGIPNPNNNPYQPHQNVNRQYQNGQNNPYNSNPYRGAPPKIVYDPYTNSYKVEEKKKVKVSTIIYISVIAVLVIAFIISMFSCVATQAFNLSNNKDNNIINFDDGNGNNGGNKGYSGDDSNPFSEYGIDGFPDYGIFGNNVQREYDSFDVEISLQEDKGDTSTNSNTKDPDPNHADIKSAPEPANAKTGDYTSENAYQKVSPAVVAVQCFKDKISDDKTAMTAEGTGTVVSQDGYIITNAHVIGNSKDYKIRVVFNNKVKKEAKIIGYDTRTDIAVLKADTANTTYVTFGDSEHLKVGADAIAIGNPGGSSFQNSLTKGIISFVGRELSGNDLVKYIQTDTSINPGNSGGPLCNIYGQVIGINASKIASTEYEGMGFAIPSETALEIANDLIHYGYVRNRVKLGIAGREITAEEIQNNIPSGILISSVDDEGPLKDKGVQENDILVAINGKEVSTFQNVYAQLENHKPGDKLKLTLKRASSISRD